MAMPNEPGAQADTEPSSGVRSADWVLGVEDRAQPAGRVFAMVLAGHLEEFRACEPGVREDGDVEALHDYRVALRRARSVLAAGRSVFPAEELDLLSALSSQFAAFTSPVRDLDVLLAGLPRRVDRVAERLRDAEDDLTDELVTLRARHTAELFAAMDSELHHALVRRWQTMASVYRVGGSEPGPDALRPAGEVVDELLADSFRRMRRAGRTAGRSERLEDWHRLRKRLKRFRYLMVGFAPMYPDGAFTKIAKRAARLQDGLGELQDHAAQPVLLETAGVDAGGRSALLAGALVAQVETNTVDALDACCSAWSDFDRKKLRRRVRAAIASGSEV